MLEENQYTESFEETKTEELFSEQIIQTLSNDEIAVVTLKLSEEYKTDEIAKILGISVGTLWEIYKRAIAHLKNIIEGNE